MQFESYAFNLQLSLPCSQPYRIQPGNIYVCIPSGLSWLCYMQHRVELWQPQVLVMFPLASVQSINNVTRQAGRSPPSRHCALPVDLQVRSATSSALQLHVPYLLSFTVPCMPRQHQAFNQASHLHACQWQLPLQCALTVFKTR